MDRKEAASLFREMFDACRTLEGKPFALMPPNADDVLSKDYQIHIMTAIDETTLLCVRRVVKTHPKLAISEQKNLLVIYEPLKNPEKLDALHAVS